MPDNFRDVLHGWQNYYLLTGTAAATLIGLMFVAASLGANVASTVRSGDIRRFVSPTIAHFASALLIAMSIAVPSLSRMSLGVLLGAGGLAGLVYALRIARDILRVHRATALDRSARFWHAGIPVMCYLLILATSAGLFLDAMLVLNLLAAAMAVLLALGIRNAWDLTVWIAQNRNT